MRPPANSERIHPPEAVEAALDRMAAEIQSTCGQDREPLLLLVVLSGGMIPAAHLALRLPLPVMIDYVHATRYRGDTRGHDVKWVAKPRTLLRGQRVLIVDDILDEGYTLAAILDYCRGQAPRSLHTAVLVEKLHDRRCPGAVADFVGLTVPDRYVFGFGMDYRELWRNLPGIYAVKEQAR